MNIRKINIKVISSIFFFILMFPSSKIFAFPYKDMEINIRGSISEMYDDNLTFSKDDKKEDFITTLTLNLGARYEGRNRALGFMSSINHRRHMRFKDIKSSSENLTLNFLNEFSDYERIRFLYTFVHTQTPVGFEEEFGRIVSRRESFGHQFNLNYSRELSEHFATGAQYTYSLRQFSEEGLKDSSQNSIGFNIDYLHSAATTFFLSYSFAKSNFDISTHTAALGMRWYLTKRLYFNGRAGESLTFIGNGTKSTSIYFDISATDEIDENTTGTVSFRRSEQVSSEAGDVFSNWQITGQLTKQLLKRLRGSFSCFYGQGVFILSDVKDTLLGTDLSLIYDFSENLQGNLNYSYSNSVSSYENSGYVRNLLSLGITRSF